MAGGALPPILATADLNRIEAPVTFKAYLMCVFASFGGILFGYDSGYISGVLSMPFFITTITGLDRATTPAAQFVISAPHQSLIVSILSAGTFFGAIIAGDLADWFGRRTTLLAGCVVYMIGVVLQTASSGLALLVVGRLIAGFGIGFVSAIVILYMSEIAPRKIRGAIVSGYQFAITIGLLLSASVDYATQNYTTSASYRIPMGLQLLFPMILGAGLIYLPESPRYFVKKGNVQKAAHALGRLRGQPEDSEYIQNELAEIIANNEYEKSLMPATSYFGSWAACFSGSLWNGNSNLRRTILGTSMQMMQQWTGINFVFYFGTTFFTELGTISNPFLITVITDLVDTLCTPVSFYTMERVGRRPLLIWGAVGMCVCEVIVALIGTIAPGNHNAVQAMIAFICIYIAFFAGSWGPGAWVVIGEIFPLPIRSRGVGLSTASNWLWNCIIAVITPYLVGADEANLGPKVFWLWGALCGCCVVYAYFLVPETKGLTLEQVDQMMEEVPARQSAKWRPHESFASKIGAANNGSKMDELNVNNSSKMDELNMKETEQQHLEASRV